MSILPTALFARSFLAVSLAFAACHAGAAALYAFATSTGNNGNLSSWPEVAGSGSTGLQAADGICAARAASANLPNAGDFAAWLSDANDDAYCRLFGLSGKKANNCAQPVLPVGAGPWLRTDGAPFAARIERATSDGAIYAPLNLDEAGQLAPGQVFTATSPAGEYDTSLDSWDCGGWTSDDPDPHAPYAVVGDTFASTQAWTNTDAAASCSDRRRLMCLQKGSVPARIGVSSFGHREAFLTSAALTGNLGGIAGADAQCRSLAATAHLYRPQTYKALITSTVAGTNALDRFVFDGPWYRRDGLLFAHDKAELTSVSVTLPLNVTESGAYVGFAVALTGAHADGSPGGLDCSNWSGITGLGFGSLVNEVALANAGAHDWLSDSQLQCSGAQLPGDWPAKIYCLADSDGLFHDAFEVLPDGV
jgi:hypothetical protein